MVEVPAAGQCVAQRVAITEIAVHPFDLKPAQVAEIAAWPNQHAHVGSRADQSPGNRASNETCRTGD